MVNSLCQVDVACTLRKVWTCGAEEVEGAFVWKLSALFGRFW